MTNRDHRKRLGESGEQAAVIYLTSQGYRVIDRNWRCKLGEIDVIALHGSQWIFAEVRTRSTSRFGSGAESVDVRKQRKLRMLAMAYMREKKLSQDLAVRFDVLSIKRMPSGKFEINHIQNAF